MKKSILKLIFDAVDQLSFKTPFIKNKAILFCEVLFSNYVYRDVLFSNYITLPHNYIKTFIPKRDHQDIIIKTLKDNNIIVVDEKYTPAKKAKNGIGISKGYKFNNKLINISNTNLNYIIYVAPVQSIDFTTISNDKNEDNFYIDYTLKMLENISVTNEVHNKIDNFQIDTKDIILNDDINDDDFYILIVDGKKYDEEHINVKYAKKVAKTMNCDLILYKKKLYVTDLYSFIAQKEEHIKTINKQKVINLENGIYNATRNDTNYRLDSNLTNFPKILLDELKFKGEELVEIDISNSQFAFLSYIEQNLDLDFIEWSQNGTLYQKIADKLNITRAEAKQYMFEIAFGKIQIEKHNIIRNIIPRTMQFIDNYKKQNTYKLFSNLLQKKESNVMIDGLLKNLITKGYEVLTVHDSIRVNKSMEEIIKKEVEDYFRSINFKCKINNK